nr:alpha-amylase family protein [Actinopolymorpha alba]
MPAATPNRVRNHSSRVDQAIWWQVYPLGFLGAEPVALQPYAEVRHRLRGLEAWLDYAVHLGCSGLLLGPIFAAESHGYDTVDHLRLDPRLGTDDDFDHLVTGAHRRGLKVLLDGVFNHVGRSFPRFVEAAAADADSPAGRWFQRLPTDDGRTEYATFEGHGHLVTLNHDEPAVAAYVTRVLTHWLDRGADGWRLDAAYAIPASFWQEVLPPVRRRHPDAWFVGEMIHGDYAGYITASGLDSITQYELWKAIWSSLNDQNFFELAWALDRHNGFLDTFAPQTFVGNHDVTRLASRLDHPDHLGHALAVLFVAGGVPSIYAGDEQAFQGVKEERAGGDDAIRPAFPESPEGLPPEGWPTFELHRRLIALRRRHPWLVGARTKVEHLTNRSCALRATAPDHPDHDLLALLNIDEQPYAFPLDTDGRMVEVASDLNASHDDPVLVPGHGWAILSR